MTVAIVLGGRSKKQGQQAHLGSLLSGVGLGHAKRGGEVARHGQGDESR